MLSSRLYHFYRRPDRAQARQCGHSRIERQAEASIDAPPTAKTPRFFDLAP